jgi:hypothetical protein
MPLSSFNTEADHMSLLLSGKADRLNEQPHVRMYASGLKGNHPERNARLHLREMVPPSSPFCHDDDGEHHG